MRTRGTSQDELTLSSLAQLHLAHHSGEDHSLPDAWQASISGVNPVELVDELVQAYEGSLRLQGALCSLMPRLTWYQAAEALRQWQDDWPVAEFTTTIMFTDIASFTALMETHPVKEVLASLNGYYTLLSRIVQQHRGDVHKFLGDGLMAMFLCPADAVRAGREIQLAVAEFNAHHAARGLWQFETRLAIDTGEVVLAGVGSPDRRDYTLIGRPVNQAAHLSEEATPGSVWVSQNVYDRLADKEGFAPRTRAAARSAEGPVTVYEMACSRE